MGSFKWSYTSSNITLIWVEVIVTLLTTPLITPPEPPSTACSIYHSGSDFFVSACGHPPKLPFWGSFGGFVGFATGVCRVHVPREYTYCDIDI